MSPVENNTHPLKDGRYLKTQTSHAHGYYVRRNGCNCYSLYEGEWAVKLPHRRCLTAGVMLGENARIPENEKKNIHIYLWLNLQRLTRTGEVYVGNN